MFAWLLKGAGLNKTTVAGFAGICGGLGLIFNGNFNEGMLLLIVSIQQLAQRWTNGKASLFLQRTFYASLGGVFTGAYMVYQGNVSEGIILFMASLQALFQRQATGKKINGV